MAVINESINKAKYEYPYMNIGYNFDNHLLHFHDETEVLYVYEGSIIADVDSENILLTKGDICVILPSQIHTLIPIGPIKIHIIKLYPTINLRNVHLKSNIFSPADEHYTYLLENIKKMVDEDSMKLPGFELSVFATCANIMLYILRNLPREKNEVFSTKSLEYSTNFINKINEYLEENYKQPISLEQVSTSFNYSKSYFSRLFKEMCGINFIDYVNIFKLKKSIWLLKNTNMSIEEIAFSSGFNNPRSYHRSFLRHFGQNPSSYRRQFDKQ